MIFYEGPSEINQEPIVGIATLHTRNMKTGPMVQTWFLNAAEAPYASAVNKTDESVCGDCPLRRNGCYVRLDTAVGSVWKKWQRGGYKYDRRKQKQALCGRTVRLGAYGDPAAVPLSIIEDLLQHSVGHTGYTHQWRWATHLIPYCMASVESLDDYDKAKLMGWRVFRIRPQGSLRTPVVEAQCPAATEHKGVKLTCHQCLACCGTSKGTGGISIEAHGIQKRKVFNG